MILGGRVASSIAALVASVFAGAPTADAQPSSERGAAFVAYGGGLQSDRVEGAYAVVLIKESAPAPGRAFCRAFLDHYHPSASAYGGTGPIPNQVPVYWPIPNEAAPTRSLASADCTLAPAPGAHTPFYDYGTSAYLFRKLELPGEGPFLVLIRERPQGCLSESGFLGMGQDASRTLETRLSLFDRYVDSHSWRPGRIDDDNSFFPLTAAKYVGQAVDSAFRFLLSPFIGDESCAPMAGRGTT